MNKRIKAAAGLAALLIMAAGTVKAEIYSATFERLSGAAMTMGVPGGSGAEAALGGMYSGSAFSGEAPVVPAAKPVQLAVPVPEVKAPDSAGYSDLAALVKAEKTEEGKDGKEEAKPAYFSFLPRAAEEEKVPVGPFFAWLTVFLFLMVLLL